MPQRTQSIAVRFLHCCLWGAAIAYVLLLGIVIVSGSPSQENSAFSRSIVAWQRPGYFATYDFRHYLTGCILFALLPWGLFLFSTRYPKGIRWLEKKKTVLIGIGIIGSLAVAGLIAYLSITHTDRFMTLLYKKQRGIELREDGFFVALTIALWCGLTLLLMRVKRLPQGTLPRIRFPQTIPVWAHLAGLGLCVFLVFNPRYAFSFSSLAQYGGEANYQFHHVVSYIGPINDVLHGKTLLIDATAQYGYGATYLPALLFWLIGLSFAGFNGYVVAVACGYGIAVYLFLLVTTRRWYWALAGTLLYIKLSFFRSVLPQETYIFPSITPLRHWPDILVLLSIVWQQRHPKRRWIVLSSTLVILAIYYNVEIGLCLAVAYLAMTISEGVFSRTLRRARVRLLSLVLAAGGISALVGLVTYYLRGQWPDFSRLVYYMFYFGRGYFDTPMPIFGAYYVVLSIYFVTYCLIAYHWFIASTRHMNLYVFLLVYGLGSFVYYLGFSEPNHLFAVVHPALFLTVLLIHDFSDQGMQILSRLPLASKSTLITYGLVLICFFLWRPLLFWQDLRYKMNHRYLTPTSAYHYWPYPGAHFYVTDDDGTAFQEAVKAIQTYVPGNTALILSRYDTLLMVMAGKTSPLPYSYLEYGIIYERDMQTTINQLQRHPPTYVFVARGHYTKTVTDNISRIWQGIQPRYTYLKSAGAVDVYQVIGGPTF